MAQPVKSKVASGPPSWAVLRAEDQQENKNLLREPSIISSRRQMFGEAEHQVRIKLWLGGSFSSGDESLYEQSSAVCGRARPRRHPAAS
jgi:hypothetical protein